MSVAVSQGILREFTRNMDYVTGRTFELVWSQPSSIEASPKAEQNELIVEALTWRPAMLHSALFEQLRRKLIMLAGSFNEEVFLLLHALLEAANGDYGSLELFARRYAILPSESAYDIYFDIDPEEAAA